MNIDEMLTTPDMKIIYKLLNQVAEIQDKRSFDVFDSMVKTLETLNDSN